MTIFRKCIKYKSVGIQKSKFIIFILFQGYLRLNYVNSLKYANDSHEMHIIYIIF